MGLLILWPKTERKKREPVFNLARKEDELKIAGKCFLYRLQDIRGCLDSCHLLGSVWMKVMPYFPVCAVSVKNERRKRV